MSQNQFSEFEYQLMKKLLKEAEKNKGITSPNPVTACAVVKNNEILAIGTHFKPGYDHAEVAALRKLNFNAKGATLYVNLEPCTHTGKVPPCVEAIIKSGIKEVVYAMLDPNPLVRKKSAQEILEQAGIKVRWGLLEKEAIVQNEAFVTLMEKKRPFTQLKVAMTLDGKIATQSGDSKYISNKKSLKRVHKIRAEVDGILVGINTILMDDPSLNVRHVSLRKGQENPKVIILDSKAKCRPSAKLFSMNRQPEDILLLISQKFMNSPNVPDLQKIATVCPIKETDSMLCWHDIMRTCLNHQIYNLLIEGGSTVFTSIIQSSMIDKVHAIMTPKLMVEDRAIPFLKGDKTADVKNLKTLKNIKVSNLNNDIWIEGYLN